MPFVSIKSFDLVYWLPFLVGCIPRLMQMHISTFIGKYSTARFPPNSVGADQLIQRFKLTGFHFIFETAKTNYCPSNLLCSTKGNL